MKKYNVCYLISGLFTIGLLTNNLSNSSNSLTRRTRNAIDISISSAETKDIETTESWNSFLKKILSDIFPVEETKIVIPQAFSNELFTDLRKNGPTITSSSLRNVIRHVYYSIYNQTPAQTILVALCQTACEKMHKYKFVKFHEDDHTRTVSYILNHKSLNSEEEIDPAIMSMEDDILERQRTNPFDVEIYKELVDFYREAIEFYPDRTRY